MALIPLDPVEDEEQQPIRVEGGTLVPISARSESPPVPRAPERLGVTPEPEDDGFTLAQGAALGARTIFPTVGQVAGPVGGAIGGAIGDTTAQLIELATGEREEFNPALTASEAALGAIPGGRFLKGASRASRLLGGAAEGALFGGGATALTSVAERGELPSASEFGAGAALGAGLGAGIGALSTPRVKPKVDEVPALGAKPAAPEVPPAVAPEPTGPKLDTAPEPGAPVIDSPRFTALIDSINSPEQLEQLAKSPGFEGQKNLLIERVAGSLAAGDIDSPEALALARELGSMAQLGELARGTSAESARVLQSLSALQRSVTKLEEAGRVSPEQANALRVAFGASPKETKRGFRQDVVIPLLNFRRAMLTGLISTGVRNTIVGVPRNFFEAVDQTLAGLIKGEGLSGAELFREAFRRPGERAKEVESIASLNNAAAREIDRLLHTPTVAEFPVERLKGAAQKIAKAVTFLNSKQELAFRRYSFNGTLKARLAAKGVDFATAISDPAKFISHDDIQFAVDRALDVTFAADPQGSLGKAYLGVFKALPELTLINPFPRFQTNATRFIWEHSPAAVLSLLGKNVEGNLLLSDPKAVADALSRMAVGTSMLAAGMAFRYSELAGERWYEVKAGDGKVIDLRPFNPLASFAFFAEGLKRMDEERSLNALKQDFGEAALSLNRAGALGFTAGDFFTGRTGTLSQENLERSLGEILGSFTRPLGQVKDFLSVAIPGEAESPDVRSAPFLGEAVRNIPFAGRVLPPARPSLTTGEPRRQPMAVLRQIAGLTVKERDVVEKALLESDIEPFTLTPRRRVRTPEGTEEQREVERQLAVLISERLPRFIEEPRFQKADRDTRRVLLTDATGKLAREAKRRADAALRKERPGLSETIRAQQLSSKPPSSVRDLRDRERLERLGFGVR